MELDESIDVSKREQLSLVFLYISTFKVCKRFAEFKECVSERNALSIAAIPISNIEEYMIGSKLVAQIYDGASVMVGEIPGANVKVTEKYIDSIYSLLCTQAQSSGASKCLQKQFM